MGNSSVEAMLQIYPYWNVNKFKEKGAVYCDKTSNLSILECKFNCFRYHSPLYSSSNLSILECKCKNTVMGLVEGTDFKSIHTGM